jgi:hypothetical protein
VDWTHGGTVYHLDGRRFDSRVGWAFPFDAAQATPDGRFVVIYQRCGTKALLIRDGKILRELNRSFYHAHVYEYPVCLWKSQDGRVLIAHCPEDYRRIEIDDAETGQRLTVGVRKPQDFFHSRLTVNAQGTRFLSAGWVWHPFDSVAYFDIAEALRDPTHLDFPHSAPYSRHVALAEESSACWQTSERVLLGSSEEEEDRQDDDVAQAREPRLNSRGIAVYDVPTQTYVCSAVLGEIPGTMMPLGESHAVCFYRHPKVVSLESGEIIARWEDLDTGTQKSSIIRNAKLPPLAIDPEHNRFAVFGPAGITVVQIDLHG